MKIKKQIGLSIIAITAMYSTSNAQGLLDGFTSKKGDLSLTTSFSLSKYDAFYVANVKNEGVPVHGEINQNIISLYAKYGITDRLSAVINVPFISADNTSGADDPINEKNSISELQDISIALKLNAHKFNFKKANLNIITGFTVIIPTGYEPNGILSLGSGAFGVDVTAGLHLNTDSGFFSTLLAAYNLRDDAENNLTPGGEFGVPNAFVTTGKIGYASKFIYVEAWADIFNSEEGVDIGEPGFRGNFPETNVDYSRVGLTVYKNVMPKLGVSLGFGKVLDGRNVGESTTFSAGLTYNVSLK
ncbi:transporter [Tenacibaculum retecalamus]|uniref:transporter n=1 Tax=Tenacibaculum retecalamus TaxID=3018315 RepID=UPI0023D937AA|nr:transporter [Tenacibaculum retecalamus]WBX71871.1 transporter [Tenacibaculum retecalamus]